jgi:hypothetical protein
VGTAGRYVAFFFFFLQFQRPLALGIWKECLLLAQRKGCGLRRPTAKIQLEPRDGVFPKTQDVPGIYASRTKDSRGSVNCKGPPKKKSVTAVVGEWVRGQKRTGVEFIFGILLWRF